MKKTNKKVLGLGALVVGGLLLKKAADSKKEAANLQTLFAPEAIASEQTESNFILDAIKNDPAVRSYIKSLGITGEQVVNQINSNVYNLDNVQFQNFGGSLLVNGAGELNNNSNFSVDPVLQTTNHFGFNTLSFSTLSINNSIVWLNKKRLYSISGYFKKNTVNGEVKAYLINSIDLTTQSVPSLLTVNETDFTYKVGFLGSHNASSSLSRVRIAFENLVCSQVVFEEIQLGQPVPDNLPWLPTGQMVYDTTTGEVGRFNGTTVDYFTMAV